MNPRFGNSRIAGLTPTEVLIVIASLILLAAVLLPALAVSNRKSNRLGCATQLRQIGISFRMWGDDNFDKLPSQVSATNGGAMETALTGNVATSFRVLSNTLDNPAILVCPNDINHFPATNFETLSNSNLSYFISLDAHDTQPQDILSGDDNLIVNGKTVGSGILNLHTNDNLAWTKDRHRGAGNILMADGSVQQATSADLTSAARLATHRLVIP